jgi:hypothetical protein
MKILQDLLATGRGEVFSDKPYVFALLLLRSQNVHISLNQKLVLPTHVVAISFEQSVSTGS